MLPWAVIVRVLTPIATAVAGRLLTNPDTVNKLANSSVMRQIARSAAKLRIKAENAVETQPELQKFVQNGAKGVKLNPEISKYVKGEISRKAKQIGKDFKSGKR